MRQQYKLKETELGTLPEEWQLLTVEDIKANDKKAIISGPFGSNISSKYFVESGIPVIRGNNLSADMTRFIDNGFVFVTPEKAKELDTWAVRGDIVFTAAGTLGQVGIIEEDSKYEKYVISNKQLRLRVNTELVRPLFAFYWFSSPEMVRYIQQRDTGSTIPLINLSVLKSLPIIVPPLEVQDEIVNILDSLDKKTSYNKNINVTLEKIGQAIFKHWFIDFEFPNEKGKPYKSSGGEMVDSELGKIPEDWSVEKLGNILSLLKDGTHNPPQRVESGIRFIAGASDIEHFDIEFEGCTYITKEDYEDIHKYWEVRANDILLTIVGTVGNVAIVKSSDIPFSLQRSIAVLRANEKSSYIFIYMWLNTREFKELIYANVNQTAQPGIYLGTLSNLKLCLPPKHLIESFDKCCEPLITKMQSNSIEIVRLTSVRDSLLPRLMSGKIRVPIEKVEKRVA